MASSKTDLGDFIPRLHYFPHYPWLPWFQWKGGGRETYDCQKEPTESVKEHTCKECLHKQKLTSSETPSIQCHTNRDIPYHLPKRRNTLRMLDKTLTNQCKFAFKSQTHAINKPKPFQFCGHVDCAETKRPVSFPSVLSTMLNILALLCSVVHTIRNSKLSVSVCQWTLVFLCLLHGAHSQTCPPDVDCYPASEDLLIQGIAARTIIASSQCGTPDATQYEDLFGDAVYSCSSVDPHPASLMIDRVEGGIGNFTFDNPVVSTWWQSVNMISTAGTAPIEQQIVARFGSKFLIQYIRVIFIGPHINSTSPGYDQRPLAVVIEKQANDTSGWEVVRMYADDCASRFPGAVIDTSNLLVGSTDVVCQTKYYAGDSSTETGWGKARQEMKYAPASEFTVAFSSDYATQKYYTVSAIRIRVVAPASNVPLRSYIAVADLEVDGMCSCYGHASVCIGVNRDVCVCKHNTNGPHCEGCQSLFNNRTWQVGANGQSNECQECGCNGHASLCHFDEVKGYGVCDNCEQNTAGDKCNECTQNYYVNPNKDQYNATNPAREDCTGFNGGTGQIETYNCGSWCIPCDCDRNGSLAGSGYNCNSETGQCSCKMFVEGRACDQCMDGYWDLQDSKIEGCSRCQCNAMGTVNNSNICDKTTGDCICKANTEGASCGQCKTAYYSLSFSNPDGCTACDCDPGGAMELTCPATGASAGLCDCRPNLSGNTCSVPLLNFYGPVLDQLTFDAEYTTDLYPEVQQTGSGELNGTVTGRGFIQVSLGGQLTFSVSVPSTTNYNIVLRYKSESLFMGSTVKLQVVGSTEIGQSYVCGGSTIPLEQPIIVGPINPPGTGSNPGALIMGSACLLQQREYNATIEVGTSLAADILIDSLVLLPILDDLMVFSNASTETQGLITACYDATLAVDLATRANMSCDAYEFSLMIELYGGAVRCDCAGIGIIGSICSPSGGQCPCKPGVMRIGCTECMVDYYGYSSGAGCTPCGCHPTGSIKTSCNDTGICQCNNNVQGLKCDSCIPENFGLTTGQGCIPCVCDDQYAVNISCKDTGQCYCKPGIGGTSCTVCLAGFYNLTSEGCTPCGCEPDGSGNSICDPVSGACTCKPRLEGDKCDTCKTTFYGVGPWHPDGCLQCFCSGHATTCGTALQYAALTQNTWDLTESAAIESRWTGVDDQDLPIRVDVLTRFSDDNKAEYVMSIKDGDFNAGRDILYFSAPLVFLDDKRGAYGQNMSFGLTQTIPELPVNATADPLLDRTGDVILVGKWTTYTLVAPLNTTLTENKTSILITFLEKDWTVNNLDGPNPTYPEMIQVLADLKAIRIRAKYINITDTVVDLYYFQMYHSAPEAASLEQLITNVETCQGFCPPGYTGQFCEECAAGYKRVTPELGPYSACAPCQCNNHDWGPCDASTAACNCTHETTGDSCQLCRDGYYGDPSGGTPGDCQPCMCPGNVPEGKVNMFAGLCEVDAAADGGFQCINCTAGHGGDHCEFCLDQWYGEPENEFNNFGVCDACSCNGRADTCNSTTGTCVDCRNNTAGTECDICAPGYTGRAPTCKPCACNDSVGATGGCDHFTGECECKPNVIGVKCDQCAFDAYDIASGAGCKACDCDQVGAVQTSCNQATGQCTCRHTTVVGRQCSMCADGFWNIKLSGCIPCDCTVEGTTPGAVTCELETGQCPCANPGIKGRTCDYCAKGTTGIYPACELCGECYDNWAKKIDAVGIELTSLYQVAMAIWSNYDNLTHDVVSPKLEYIGSNLTAVESSIVMAVDMVSQLNYIKDGFDQIALETANNSDIAENITLYGQRIQLELTANKQFTGLLQINNTHQATPDQLVQYTSTASTYIDALYTAANATWGKIENQTRLIQQSNGNIDVFLISVSTAMVVLRQARVTREATENILGGGFTTQYADNTVKLTQLQTAITGYPAQIAQITSNAQNADAMCLQANQTAVTASTLVNQRLAEMTAKVAQAQGAKLNATQARTASVETEGAVFILQDKANLTKLQMTRTIEDIARGLRTLASVEADILRSMSIETNASLVQMRPLQDMRDITLQIESTQVSPNDVTQTLLAAENGLQVAAEAQNVTELAVSESNAALEMFNRIRENLTETQTLNRNTQSDLNQLNEKNATIRFTLSQVSSKAVDNQELADRTAFTINSLLASIGSISQCLDGLDSQLDVEVGSLRAANVTAQLAGQSVLANQNQAGELSAPVTQKLNEFQAQYVGVTQLELEVNALTADLDQVTAIVDLQRMQNEYTAQRLEMSALLAELNSLEAQLDALLAALNLLDSKDTTCAHN